MTGTAMTEEDEFRTIYSLDVVPIPTNRPVQRVDYADMIYSTVEGKKKAIVNEVGGAPRKGSAYSYRYRYGREVGRNFPTFEKKRN